MAFNGWSVLSILVLLAGVGLWLSLPVPGDVGAMAVGITFVGFGAAGLLASLVKPRAA